jgi:hypothetical protein
MYEKYATGSRYGPTLRLCKHGTEYYNSLCVENFREQFICYSSKENNVVDLGVY